MKFSFLLSTLCSAFHDEFKHVRNVLFWIVQISPNQNTELYWVFMVSLTIWMLWDNIKCLTGKQVNKVIKCKVSTDKGGLHTVVKLISGLSDRDNAKPWALNCLTMAKGFDAFVFIYFPFQVTAGRGWLREVNICFFIHLQGLFIFHIAYNCISSPNWNPNILKQHLRAVWTAVNIHGYIISLWNYEWWTC